MLTALAFTVAAPRVRAAEPEGDASLEARKHYQKAQSAYDEARYEDAITEFKAAYALKPHPNVILKLDRQWRTTKAETGTSQWNAAVGYLF